MRMQTLGEVRDKIAAIGEIDVMRAGIDCRGGHVIALALLRPGAMHDYARREIIQRAGEIRRGKVEARAAYARIQPGGTLAALRIATSGDHLGAAAFAQRAADASAEIPVPPQYDYAHPVRSYIKRGGILQGRSAVARFFAHAPGRCVP